MGTDEQIKQHSETAGASAVFCPEQLLKRCLGQIDLAQRVIGLFMKSLDADVAQLLEAGQQHDEVRLARTAHRMKGSAASIGAQRLQQLMAALEQAAKEQTHGEVETLLRRLTDEAQPLRDVLTSWHSMQPTAASMPSPAPRSNPEIPPRRVV